MPLSHIVNNCGVGKVEATFRNITTTVGGKRPFTDALIDAHRRACHLHGNDQVSWNNTTTNSLFGCVLAASEDVFTGKTFPARCVVQVAGFAEMGATTGHSAPAVSDDLLSERQGLVAMETTSVAMHIASGVLFRRGKIVNLYAAKRVTVLF